MPIPFTGSHAPALVITGMQPMVDGGRHPVKSVAGDPFTFEADVFKDGHDLIKVYLLWRPRGEEAWREAPMEHVDNDRWRGKVCFPQPGAYQVTVAGYPDALGTWLSGMRKKVEAEVDGLEVEVEEGAQLVKAAALRARLRGAGDVARDLLQLGEALPGLPPAEALDVLEDEAVREVLRHWEDRSLLTFSDAACPVLVERERARFSAWYEFFPRNAIGDGETHATLRDCGSVLKHAADMGFDVVYLPPVHPIGTTNRKGRNNAERGEPDDIGSPWAIGGAAGGHRAVEPALGTLDDFDFLVGQAKEHGLEVAMDFALQCSPDHPWVRDHPEWFHVRPDGSIKYAENPPKKYQDIYPLSFHGSNWRGLWEEVRDTLLFWCARGVRIYRVDNPHTKPVAMWEWVLAEVRKKHPDTIFLSEAFTRPKMMAQLAKVGFSQSYTYFTWRTTKQELTDYVLELAGDPLRWFMRGNFWPNTPDILAYELWEAPPAKFKIRATLAALLMPSWGIYSGYEFCENRPHPPKEEYADSEKYQLTRRDWMAEGITAHIRALNRVRAEEAAFRFGDNIRFCSCQDDKVLGFYKVSPDGASRVLVVVTLDAEARRQTTVALPDEVVREMGGGNFKVTDLLTHESWTWKPGPNFVAFDPGERIAHVFRIES